MLSVNKTGLSIFVLCYAHKWTWKNAKMAARRICYVRFAKQTAAKRISSHCWQQGSLNLFSFTSLYTRKNSPSELLYTTRSALLFLARVHGPPNVHTGTGSEQKIDRQPCLKQAQWTFYSCKAYWVRDAPTVLAFKNFTFCPRSVFMCFVFVSEQIATFAPYNINWLVFITKMKSVYCAVRTGSLTKAVCALSLNR